MERTEGVCKFFATKEGCRKGDQCPFQHPRVTKPTTAPSKPKPAQPLRQQANADAQCGKMKVVLCELCKVDVTEANLYAHQQGKKHRQLNFEREMQLKRSQQKEDSKKRKEEQKAKKERTKKNEQERKLENAEKEEEPQAEEPFVDYFYRDDVFHQLPEELLLFIFSLLHYQDLLSLSLVNTQWHRILQDSTLWRSLVLSLSSQCK